MLIDDLVGFSMQLIENGQHTSLHVQGDTEFAQMGSGMGPAGAGKKEDLVNCIPGIRPLPLSSHPPSSNRSSKELPALAPSFIVLSTPQLVLTSFQLTSRRYTGARIRASINGVSLSREGNG